MKDENEKQFEEIFKQAALYGRVMYIFKCNGELEIINYEDLIIREENV